MIYKLDPLGDPRWQALVDRHPNASVFHTSGWLEAVRRTYGYKPVVFTTSSPTHELRSGLLFCRIRSWLAGRRMVSLPLSDSCEPLCDSDEFEVLLHYLQSAFDHQDWKSLEIRLFDGHYSSEAKAAGFSIRDKHLLHRLSLQSVRSNLFESFHEDSLQHQVQGTERPGLVERIGKSERLLKDFYGLYLLNQQRQKVPPQPYKWFQNVVRCMDECLEIRTAYENDIPIASILTLRFRNTVYCRYGYANAQFNHLGSMPFLLLRAMREAKSNGATRFDLGRMELGNTELIAFKSRWASQPQTLTYWEFPGSLADSVQSDWKAKVLKGVFSLMSDRMLTATGRFFYPYIG